MSTALTEAISRLLSPEWEGPVDQISCDLAVAELLLCIRENEDVAEAALALARVVTA